MTKVVGGITLYDTRDIAAQMGVAESTVRSWIREGKLIGRKIGRGWIVTEGNLQAFLSGSDEGQPIGFSADECEEQQVGFTKD